MNNKYQTIEFTLEIGGEEINFLDLSINIKNKVHEFRIHKKPTATDTLINVGSFCPWSHKLAAVNNMIHRITRIPLNQQSFQKEVQIIKHLVKKNQLHVDVENMIKKKVTR